MGRNTGLLGAAAALLVVVGVSAQGRNLDGKWTLDTAKSGPAPSSQSGRRPASDFTIKTDAKTFVVTTTRSGEETVMTYKLDGSDSWNTPGRGEKERAYKFTWSGDKAVITSKIPGGEETTEYWLEGDSLVRQVTRPGTAGASPTNVKTYFKRAT